MKFIGIILALLLFFCWILFFIMFKITSVLIHLLLLFAVISLILNLISGKKKT